MAGPFEFRRPGPAMPPPAAPQRQAAPAPAPRPSEDRFMEMLRANGVVNQGGPPMAFPGAPPSAFAREPIMPRPPQSMAPSVTPDLGRTPEPPAPPAKFTPGEPGQPKSGLTVHQLAKDPALCAAVDKWFATTKRKSIKGPDLLAMLKDQAGMEMSVRQAAGLAKRLNQKREEPARDYFTQAAGKVMKE